MATDKLKQVGKKIEKFQHESSDTSRYISRNLLLIEQSQDFLSPLYPYILEFKMYEGNSAYLSLNFLEKFGTKMIWIR